ncbi:hypothetical protein T265_10915 [Opisthorchis viverrini]|uniref:Uncharacterized protein n=1 Tax=Opisthorchis viverrini TaxID=6198 RepID=A0A074Z0T1_OPIVI|nr:hypothetical protein T265_10915 [Opisthorchis viverrini]KER20568.1 hypothetical protein T265_10915 [Opisthorchis viverrini]
MWKSVLQRDESAQKYFLNVAVNIDTTDHSITHRFSDESPKDFQNRASEKLSRQNHTDSVEIRHMKQRPPMDNRKAVHKCSNKLMNRYRPRTDGSNSKMRAYPYKENRQHEA